ncbi:MAG: MBL fold metallo-hydrolase, partial [Arenicella sp.]|nr:MBL fold metallo-hydrolase [Arenicella sp.]
MHEPVAGDTKVRVRYFGHATVLLETAETTIMTDPIISYDQVEGDPRYSYKDLPDKIDYVVLTHNHQDHVMLETLLQIRHRIGAIVVPRCSGGALHDPSLKLMLKVLGFENVIELSEMESVDIEGGSITGIPFLGEHGDLTVLTKLAYHVSLEDERFLFAADSNNLDPHLYENIHKVIGDIDHVFIGMECDGAPMSWLYGPLYHRALERKFDVTRRLDGSNYGKAYDLIKVFNPKSVYVYAMGAEPWLNFISSIDYTDSSIPIVESDKLITRCKDEGITAERLYGFKQIDF